MKLFDIFKKQNDEKRTLRIRNSENDGTEVDSVPEFKCDIVKWHYTRAESVYRAQENKIEGEELEDSDMEIICEYAGNHIAYFITWLIENNFYNVDAAVGPDRIEEVNEAIKKVKSKKITGYTFLSEYCDKKFYKKDVVEDVRDFVSSYYNDKFKVDYKGFIQMSLGKEVNGLVFSWDEYESFSGMIDIAFENHKLSNK